MALRPALADGVPLSWRLLGMLFVWIIDGAGSLLERAFAPRWGSGADPNQPEGAGRDGYAGSIKPRRPLPTEARADSKPADRGGVLA